MTHYRMLLMLSLITLFIPAFSMEKEKCPLRRRLNKAITPEGAQLALYGGFFGSLASSIAYDVGLIGCSFSTKCIEFCNNPDNASYITTGLNAYFMSCVAAGCCIGFCCRTKLPKGLRMVHEKNNPAKKNN